MPSFFSLISYFFSVSSILLPPIQIYFLKFADPNQRRRPAFFRNQKKAHPYKINGVSLPDFLVVILFIFIFFESIATYQSIVDKTKSSFAGLSLVLLDSIKRTSSV